MKGVLLCLDMVMAVVVEVLVATVTAVMVMVAVMVTADMVAVVLIAAVYVAVVVVVAVEEDAAVVLVVIINFIFKSDMFMDKRVFSLLSCFFIYDSLIVLSVLIIYCNLSFERYGYIGRLKILLLISSAIQKSPIP